MSCEKPADSQRLQKLRSESKNARNLIVTNLIWQGFISYRFCIKRALFLQDHFYTPVSNDTKNLMLTVGALNGGYLLFFLYRLYAVKLQIPQESDFWILSGIRLFQVVLSLSFYFKKLTKLYFVFLTIPDLLFFVLIFFFLLKFAQKQGYNGYVNTYIESIVDR